MIASLFADLGVWAWWLVGVILITIEVLAPGTFFLWFGLAAIAVGTITMIFGTESAIWVWQAQVLAFAILSLAFAIYGRSLMQKKGWDNSDNPQLNERGAQLVGRSAVLTQPISEGMGRAKIGDTTWRVKGPDLPEGTRVKIIAADAETLEVEAN